jgi:arylsulfatase A-like enzyme
VQDINQSVLDWVGNDPRPFFAFMNIMDTHDPYLPPQPYRSMFSDQEDPGGLINTEKSGDPVLTPEQRQGEIDAYDGSIRWVDGNLEQLITRLTQDQDRELLVVLTSDHGEAFDEHDTYMHGNSLYREEIQVPLIMWWPGKIPARVRVDQAVSITSIPATILDLTGSQPANVLPGESLVQYWDASRGKAPTQAPRLYLAGKDWKPKDAPVFYGWIKSIIQDGWQYLEYETLPPELFNLDEDPAEQNNQIENSSIHPLLSTLKSLLSP